MSGGRATVSWWPDAVRDAVLAKAEGAGAKPKRAARKKKGDDEGQGGLFG